MVVSLPMLSSSALAVEQQPEVLLQLQYSIVRSSHTSIAARSVLQNVTILDARSKKPTPTLCVPGMMPQALGGLAACRVAVRTGLGVRPAGLLVASGEAGAITVTVSVGATVAVGLGVDVGL